MDNSRFTNSLTGQLLSVTVSLLTLFLVATVQEARRRVHEALESSDATVKILQDVFDETCEISEMKEETRDAEHSNVAKATSGK